MWKRRNKRSRAIHLPEVNVIPLIDVALMLLLVFMITAPMLRQGIKVDLPQGKSQETRDLKEEIVVFLDKSGKTYLNDKALSEDQLLTQLRQSAATANTVFVKGDRDGSYGRVIELVDRIKLIPGLKYVALSTRA
jgi:biopolymer transport protein TolR